MNVNINELRELASHCWLIIVILFTMYGMLSIFNLEIESKINRIRRRNKYELYNCNNNID